jgi:hypoxanthine phosphoribosyltransferase
MFGELSRALALRVVRSYDPEIVIGVATAGVIPAAVVAAILDREFHSIVVSRRYHSDVVRETPSIFGAIPPVVRDRRVLIVDETCDSGTTLRLAVGAVVNAGAAEVRTAVAFRTGSYEPDFHALATESEIILPGDREELVGGELVSNPLLAERDR